MATSRLAQILEREYQSQGLIGGLGSAMGKRVREKIDLRNTLFGGSSISSAIGRKIFGKGYSATSSGTKKDVSGTDISSKLGSQSEDLRIISEATKVTAKNTLAIPSMARDMFLVKENIIRLVKLNKGTPRTKAGDWFSRQQARESSLKFGTSPTKSDGGSDNKPAASSGGGFLGMLGSIFSSIAPSSLIGLAGTVVALGAAFAGLKVAFEKILELSKKLWNWVANTEIGRAMGMSPVDTGESNRSGGQQGTGEGGRSLKNPMDVSWGKVWDKTKEAGSNSVSAGEEYLAYRVAKSTLPKTDIKLSGGKTFIKDGKYVSASKLAGEGKLGQIVEKLRKFAVEAAKKGWGPRILKKITGRLGAAVASKLAIFLASLASAGWTAGISLALTVISFGLMVKDIYDIYDAIMGPGGIWEELTEEDKVSPSPNKTEKTQEEKNLEQFDKTISSYEDKLKNATTKQEKDSLQKAIDGMKESRKSVVAAAEKSRGGQENSGTSPSQSNLNGVSQEMTFNQMTKEQQDTFLLNQAHAEGSDKPGTVGHRHNNPGNITAKSPTEVYPAQAKFGGVPGETITGPDGKTRTFVRFPTWQDGLNAQRDLWARKYGNVPLGEALHSWVDPKNISEMAQYQTAVFGGAGKNANTPSGGGKASDTGNMLASLPQNPFTDFAQMISSNFDKMLNDYHQSTKDGNTNFDGGKLEAYNQDFMQKLLGLQGFQPNKA